MVILPIQNKFRQQVASAIIDDIDSDLLGRKWHLVNGRAISKRDHLHSIIAERMNLTPPIFHRDGDKLNNRRSNLVGR